MKGVVKRKYRAIHFRIKGLIRKLALDISGVNVQLQYFTKLVGVSFVLKIICSV